MLNVFRSAGFDEHALLDSGVIRVTLELESRPEYLEQVEKREWTAAVRSSSTSCGPRRSPSSRRAEGPAPSVTTSCVTSSPAGSKASVHAVCRRGGAFGDLTVYATLGEVPGPVDLALIAVPHEQLAEVVRDCGAKGVGGLVLVASGDPGEKARTEGADPALVELARNFGMRLVGPDCMGVINTSADISMNASVAEHPPLRRAGGLLVPVRRPRDRPSGRAGRTRARHLQLRLPRRQGGRQRQRPAALLGAGPRDRRHPALPRVVRQSPQVQPHRPSRGPQDADRGGQERPYRLGAARAAMRKAPPSPVPTRPPRPFSARQA